MTVVYAERYANASYHSWLTMKHRPCSAIGNGICKLTSAGRTKYESRATHNAITAAMKYQIAADCKLGDATTVNNIQSQSITE